MSVMKAITVKLPDAEAKTALLASFCAPCEADKLAQQERLQVESDGSLRWEGVLAMEDTFTGDGRMIKAGGLQWENFRLPFPLRWDIEDDGAHAGAVVVGLIETVERVGNQIMGRGFIDTGSHFGQEAARLMNKGLLSGVSVDLDDMDAEFTEEGQLIVNSARLRAATLVDVPAFVEAQLFPVLEAGSDEVVSEAGEATVADGVLDEEGLVASIAPVAPPAEWFENPSLREPTPITVDDDGRVYGHIALWGTCHTGSPGVCVTPPRSYTNYALFRTGDLVTADGTHVPVGHLTMSTGHAGTRLNAASAMAHYDNTGNVAADVTAGEDEHGIWIAGALRSTLSDEEVREFRAAPMSGDWRTVGGNLELIAVLAVNMPGFPVPRTRALVASGRTVTLFSPTPTEEVAKNTDIRGVLNRAEALAIAREMGI